MHDFDRSSIGIGMGGSKLRILARWGVGALVLVVPAMLIAGPGTAKKKRAKHPCAEDGRTYFQQLPPAPIWPHYEAMEAEITQGKGDRCNLRVVMTQKETLELLTYRAVCRKSNNAYRCAGEGGSGAVWFQVAGRGEHRRMTLHLPEPGLTLTGLANRDLTDRIRTWRGAIVIELTLARDGQSDDKS